MSRTYLEPKTWGDICTYEMHGFSRANCRGIAAESVEMGTPLKLDAAGAPVPWTADGSSCVGVACNAAQPGEPLVWVGRLAVVVREELVGIAEAAELDALEAALMQHLILLTDSALVPASEYSYLK